ncbi:MAG: type III pantothenate kinase [Acutalibacteraceae bacterium]|jgi:type III pantothenate kinase
MLLALDVGNTNITLGVFEDDRLLLESRIATDHQKTGDQYAVELLDILRLYDVNAAKIDGAIICSVVPPLDKELRRAVKLVTGQTALMVGPGIKTGVNVRIDDPAQLGPDLLVGAVAAIALYGAPCIVWDLGTATTLSAVNAKGEFCGGAIMPGVVTSFESLTSRAALLPRIRLEAPARAIGTNSNDSMQSGAVFGTAAMIDGMCERALEEMGTDAVIVATGGLGREIIPHCKHKIIYNDNLLMEGLRLIYNKNH